MAGKLDDEIEREFKERLAKLLAVPASRIRTEREASTRAGRIDLLVSAGERRFAVEWRASSTAAEVAMALRSVRAFVESSKSKLIPLFVAPYVGEVGQQLCDQAEVSWMDLSGNAHLLAPGLRVVIEGKPNRYKRAGRPRSVFAPKSSRIVRWLLMEPRRAFSQRELAQAAGLDEGFTSRIVRHLKAQELVASEGSAIRVADPSKLLTAWREAYDFSKHHIVRGHVSARSSEAIVQRMAARLKDDGLEHAVTGLPGAWLISHFAGFRLVSIYVSRLPSPEWRQAAGFYPEAQGGNVWLVVPKDLGVFQGVSEREGVRCVHPVQVYMDLKDQPERASEAAQVLRQELFKEGSDG